MSEPIRIPKRRDPPSWRDRLIKRGKLHRAIVANVVTILTNDERWKDVLAYDSFRLEIVKTKRPPWHADAQAPSETYPCELTESDVTRLQDWLSREFLGLEAGPKVVDAAVRVVAERNEHHGPRDYLAGLSWDGTARVERLFVDCFGAPDSEYVRSIGKLWMISAVARVFRPGCQADYTIVLEGKTGIRKTTGIEALCGKEWFSDTGVDINDKDGEQQLQGVWIYCFDELDSLKRGDVTRVKNYLTRRVARYRASYARKNAAYPRQNVFCATTNEEEYLIDRTGNRRFWPIRCLSVNVKAIREQRDQLWAEAVALYKRNEEWWPSRELEAMCEAEQRQRLQVDPWEDQILEYARSPYILVTESGVTVRQRISNFTVTQVLVTALEKRLGDLNKADEMRVSAILKDNNYEKLRKRIDGKRCVFWIPTSVGPHDQYGNSPGDPGGVVS